MEKLGRFSVHYLFIVFLLQIAAHATWGPGAQDRLSEADRVAPEAVAALGAISAH